MALQDMQTGSRDKARPVRRDRQDTSGPSLSQTTLVTLLVVGTDEDVAHDIRGLQSRVDAVAWLKASGRAAGFHAPVAPDKNLSL